MGGGGGLIFEEIQINANSVKFCIQHYTENHNLDVKVEANV